MNFDPKKKKELEKLLATTPTPDPCEVFTLLREALGLNKEAFARQIGVSASCVGRWEKYTKDSRVTLTSEQMSNLSRLSHELDLSLYDLKINFDIVVPFSEFKNILGWSGI